MTQLGLLRAALQRVRPSVLLPLVVGNLLLFGTAVLGLKIPDSHTWQLALSLLLALGLLSVLLLWNAVAVRRLRAPLTAVSLWKGALLLGIWLLLAALLFHIAGLAEPNVETRAGLWNSQLSPGLRRLLPYTRLVGVQHAVITFFRWVFVPGLLLPFAVETATIGAQGNAFGRALRVVMSVLHWAVAVVALGVGAWAVPALAMWHPTNSVGGEVVSAALRLSVAGMLVVVVALLMLTVDAELLHRKATLRAPPKQA